jgi:dihydrofolate reductase
MTRFDMVAAADEDRGLGKDGQLPWRLPGDMAFFARITSTTEAANKRNAVIMGRKTWESIPARYQPLAKRLNAVLTRRAEYQVPDGVLLSSSLDELLVRIGEMTDIERVFVIGGGEIYHLGMALPNCERVYLTQVEGRFDCDAFFPQLGPDFELVESSERQEENEIGYVFQTWQRSNR